MYYIEYANYLSSKHYTCKAREISPHDKGGETFNNLVQPKKNPVRMARVSLESI